MTGLDFQILDWMQENLRCGFLDALMPFVSFLGNGGAIWLIATLPLLVKPRYRKHGVYLLCALLAGFVICNLILKPLIARPRPCWLRPEISLLIAMPRDFSFPSGHTVSSFAAAMALTRANRKFGWLAFPFATLIAFSRLYLYVHFPSDVFAGLLLGLIFGLLPSWVAERLTHRKECT